MEKYYTFFINKTYDLGLDEEVIIIKYKNKMITLCLKGEIFDYNRHVIPVLHQFLWGLKVPEKQIIINTNLYIANVPKAVMNKVIK